MVLETGYELFQFERNQVILWLERSKEQKKLHFLAISETEEV